MQEKVMTMNALREDKVKTSKQEVEDVEEFVYCNWDKGICRYRTSKQAFSTS